MRWVRPEWRIVKRFAIFPIEIDDEIRWLETVYIHQHYGEGGLLNLVGWWNKKFVSREDYETYKVLKKYNKKRENRSK